MPSWRRAWDRGCCGRPVLAIVSDLAPDDCRGEEYGRLEEMAFRGILFGSLVGFAVLYLLSRDAYAGGLTLDLGGWRVLFLGFTAATLLAAAIAWRGIPETLERSGRGRKAPRRRPPSPRINRLRRLRSGIFPANCASCWGLWY